MEAALKSLSSGDIELWRHKSLMLERLNKYSKDLEGTMRTLAYEMLEVLRRSHPQDEKDRKVDVTVFHLSELTLLIVGPFGSQMLLEEDRDVEFFPTIFDQIAIIKEHEHCANHDKLTASISEVHTYVLNRSITLCYKQMGVKYPDTDLGPAMLSADQSDVNWKLRTVLQTQRLFNKDRVLQVFSLRFGLITNSTSWNDIKYLRGEPAVKMLDLLDEVASLSYVGTKMQECCKDLGRRLCQASAEIPTSLYMKDNIIQGNIVQGYGGFALVYKGTLGDQDVAIKVSHSDPKHLKAIHREAAVWKHLVHPNIMPLLGIIRETIGNCIRIVIPWMEYGTIMNYIELNPEVDRLPLIHQVAQGVAYLHSIEPALVHCDLKGRNLLVGRKPDGKIRVCITDFGISIWEDYSVIPSQADSDPRGSTRWMAPELYGPRTGWKSRHTRATDIYAFGMTIYEIMTGSVPFCDMMEVDIQPTVKEGGRPAKNEHIPGIVWNLISQCWEQDPEKRLSATGVETEISNILSTLHDAAVKCRSQTLYALCLGLHTVPYATKVVQMTAVNAYRATVP